MGKLSYLFLTILCTIVSQEAVAVLNENDKLSSVPHIRQKRMNNGMWSHLEWTHPEGNNPQGIHAPRPLPTNVLEQDLREVIYGAPTRVEIILNGKSIGPGFAIHPYIIITRAEYLQPGYCIVTHIRGTGRYSDPLPIHDRIFNYALNVVVVELERAILLDNPVPSGIINAPYTKREYNWAFNMANTVIEKIVPPIGGREQLVHDAVPMDED